VYAGLDLEMSFCFEVWMGIRQNQEETTDINRMTVNQVRPSAFFPKQVGCKGSLNSLWVSR